MQTPRYRFDRFELQPTERRLLVEGQPAVLGARAFDVLMALVERRGRVVGKDELLEAAWPGLVVEENNLAVQISTLRKLLGSRLIATVAGRGYQFAGALVEAGAAPATPAFWARPPLIGRDAELETLTALLAEHRLVTLVGAGGIGKTSLAEAWRRDQSGNPVTWVELATLADTGGAPQAKQAKEALQKAVATALAVSPGELPAALAAQPHTLVLDNAEPLADAVAHWAQAALAAAPQLRLLVTSQVPLRLQAERVCRIGALPLPDERVSPVQALGFGSVALFVERASVADPQFALTTDNVGTVAEICRRLDGVPLALELAAARVGALGLNALAAALDERFRVLGGGSRAAPARQRTLRAALEWSYGLLEPDAQALLRCLGSFASAFSLQDAQQAAAAATPPIDAWAVLAALGALVENSLVNVEPGDPPAYQLPESTRMFALDQQRAGAPALPMAPTATPPPAADENTRRLLGGLSAERAVGDIEQGTVIALAQRFRPDEVRNFDAAVKELERAVEIASRVVATSGDEASDAFVGDVLAGLAEQTRSGNFDAGTDAVDEALAELERREARQRAAWRRSRRALLEAGVQQDLLRRDAFAVARRIESLAALDDAERPTWAATFLQQEAHYLAEGVDQGTHLSLAVAIELLRRRLAAARQPAERRDAGRLLAQALATLGERESADDAAREAVQVCRAALAEADRAASPREWAALQHELAGALRSLGEREGDGAVLEESVECSRRALKERPRSQVPLDWAASQHALGNSLRCLGGREAGTTRLADAARALREALNERSRARVPLEWARTQNILAITLSLWARREAGTVRHHEAVAALREALKELTRERAPLDWARLQNTLGIELATIGEIEQDADTLRAAVVAYRDALSVCTLERAPQYWALMQHNLGGALRALGDRESDPQCLHEAIEAFQAALTRHTRERFPLHWAAGKNDLGLALRSLGERETGRSGEAALEEAVAVLREAVSVRTRETLPMDWATTQGDLALALVTLGERRGERSIVEAAVVAGEQALQVLTRDAAPAQRAEVQGHIERARGWLLKAGSRPQRRAG